MRIKIVLYGVLKVLARTDEVECHLERDGATVDDVFEKMAELVGLSRERLGSVVAGVGEELVERSHPLRDGDVVMLLPPVSGG